MKKLKPCHLPKLALHIRDVQEGILLNPTRPETFAFQTRPDGTRRVVNPTRPDPPFLKNFKPDPTRPENLLK